MIGRLFNKNTKTDHKERPVQVKRFKISGMHCSSCAMMIDGDLEEVKGIKSSKTNFAKSETEVGYEADKVSEKIIIDTIKKTGYSTVPLEK